MRGRTFHKVKGGTEKEYEEGVKGGGDKRTKA